MNFPTIYASCGWDAIAKALGLITYSYTLVLYYSYYICMDSYITVALKWIHSNHCYGRCHEVDVGVILIQPFSAGDKVVNYTIR